MWPPPVEVAFDGGYDGPLRIVVSLGSWQHDFDGDKLVELVGGLIVLADRGAFVRSDLHPREAAMRTVATKHAPPAHYQWEVEARAVDHRFSQIFRNQISMHAAGFCPVTYASIEMVDTRRSRLPAPLPPLDPIAVAERKVYPERSQKLRFRFSDHDVVDYATERRAEIELVSPYDDGKLAAFREWFDRWARDLDCAYASTEQAMVNGRCAIWDYRTDILDAITVETHLGYWGAPECAWDSYANLVGRIDAELAEVAELRIY